jgi:glycosyltransferase involved in cell wall biosynthesis
MNKGFTVSICMITYNHEPYIKQAIEGVLMQKCNFPIELIIGEDCSTDKTRQICKDFELKHSEIKLLPSETNIGMMQNFIKTLQACTSKYIAFCEGDDYWTDPYKLQKQVDFLESNADYGLIYTNHKIRTECSDKPYTAPAMSCYSGEILEKLIKQNFIASLTVCFRSSLLSKIDIAEITSNKFLMGDYPMWLQIANITKIHYLDEVTSIYRVTSESASHSTSLKNNECFILSSLRVQLFYLKKFGIKNITENELKVAQYSLIMDIAFLNGDYLKAKYYVDQLPLNNVRIAIKYLITRNILIFKAYKKIAKF